MIVELVVSYKRWIETIGQYDKQWNACPVLAKKQIDLHLSVLGISNYNLGHRSTRTIAIKCDKSHDQAAVLC